MTNKRLRGFIILNKFILFIILLFGTSCTRYIFYQEKLTRDEALFTPKICSKEYALQSDIYLGPKDTIQRFKNYRFQKDWGSFHNFLNLAKYQQYLRPETLTPSSRAQLFFKTKDKLYYGEATSKKLNDDLTSPLFFLIYQLQNQLKVKSKTEESIDQLVQNSKVDFSFDFIVKKNQELLTKLGVSQKEIRNFYFKGGNIIRPNESYYFNEGVIPLKKFNLSHELYQFRIEEIDLNDSSFHSNNCSQFENRSPQTYFNFVEQNQKEHWSHQFGLTTPTGDTYLAIISHSNLSSNYQKTALMKGIPGPSAPWCFIQGNSQKQNFELLIALNSSNANQLLQLAIKQKKEHREFLTSLKIPRFIVLNSPYRMISEYHSEEESQNALKNVPFASYQIKLQQLPIYHLDKIGNIIGIVKNEQSQGLYLDGREEYLNLSCPEETLLYGQ